MNKELNKELIAVTAMLPAEVKEISVEGENILPDYYPNIIRIIKSDATPFISSTTVNADKITVEGTVLFRNMYVSEENGKLSTVSMSVPFSQTFGIDSVCNPAYIAKANTTYINTRAMSPQKIYNKATVLISICKIEKKEYSVLSENNDNIFTSSEQIDVSQFEIFGQKSIHISEVIDTDGNEPSRILWCYADVKESEKKLFNDKLIVKTEIVAEIAYISNDSEKIKNTIYKTTVSQSVELHGVNEKMNVFTDCTLSNYRAYISEEQNDSTIPLIFEAEVSVNAIAVSNTEIKIVTDAFSTEEEISCDFEEIKAGKLINSSSDYSIREKIEIRPFTDIHEMTASVNIKDTVYDSSEGTVFVNGDLKCLFIISDENNDYAVSESIIPFSTKINAEKSGDGVISNINNIITAKAFAVAGGTSVDIRIDGCCIADLFIMKSVKCLVSAEKKDKRFDSSKNGITVYYPSESETIYNIAKKFHKNPDEIIAANSISEDKKLKILII